MKFVIRDDDLNYFSTSADIERWYTDVFWEGIPVGFSTIPFVKPESDVYTADAPAGSGEQPISGNAALVAYVEGNPLIEILQHGTTHETKGRVFEYAGHIPLGEVKRGREELERAFSHSFRPIFVPPHDWIDEDGVRAVEAAGMDIIRGRGAGLRNWLWRWQYTAIFFRMLVFKLWYTLHGTVPAYPFVLDFGKHREVCSYRLEDEDVFAGLEYAKRREGVFVVVTHLHFFTEEKKKRLVTLIERARALGAECVAPSALFRRPDRQ